ncbi:hypothetical protein SAY87_000130 [Trapa incisa]|uniref:Uncharacterized protein n=1 Tax=Trapa incisa TaxID=236973 RepID=A0AAN7GI35_9MYRT|nr:hypothetical protein SAY87_000130 [Trapa incisa]
MQMAIICRPASNKDSNHVWKALTKPTSGEVHALNGGSSGGGFRRPLKIRKCSSLRAATSFTRVCLCGTISSYNEVFRAEYVPPRRSYSYPGSKPVPSHALGSIHQERGAAGPATSPRPSIEMCRSRVVFRGKSLKDDVIMRRFVMEEEEAMLQVRKRNQMEAIRKRSIVRRRRKLGPSPLSRMVKADDLTTGEEEEEEEEEE